LTEILENAFRRLLGRLGLPFLSNTTTEFKFSQATTDDEWLAKVAAAGCIVFSHDRKFHTLLPEITAIKQYKAGCFYLPGASSPTWDKMCLFMRAYDGIVERITTTTKPFIFEISGSNRFMSVAIP
jgi:hypothetical protein